MCALRRALARVLAHEIFHIISNEREHGAGGVFQAALSGRDLIAERLDFHPDGIARPRLRSPAALPCPAVPVDSLATRD